MIRQPIVAGRFYPGSAASLEREVRAYLSAAGAKAPERTLLAMVPHAGYPYSGPVAGLTLGRANLADTLLLLGPNHTGLGRPLSVWNRGQWLTPLGAMPVDEKLADALTAADPRFQPDRMAHEQEHSLEVLLPFLQVIKHQFTGVPVCVAETRTGELASLAKSVAGVLRDWPEPVSLVVSSDMSHYVSHETARQLDAMALEAATRLDPEGLFETVRANGITMCGVLPMTLGLMIARELGASKAELTAYATSGDASGDFARVVGYAGILVS